MVVGLSISVEQKANKRILRLKGRLDAQTLPSLDEQIEFLLENKHLRVLLDFSNIEALSEETAEMLHVKTKKFKESKGRLGLFGINGAVLYTIEKLDLSQLLLIYPNESEALKAMGT